MSKAQKIIESTNVSGSLLKDWQMWEDCILSFLRSHRGLRAKFNEHVDEWNEIKKLPLSAYERVEEIEAVDGIWDELFELF